MIFLNAGFLRISARLGWTKDCKEPEQTRQSLEAWLPEDRWNEQTRFPSYEENISDLLVLGGLRSTGYWLALGKR